MTSSQYSSDSHSAVEIPWALSATDVVYNIPGIHAGLKLNATIVAEIYTGKITSVGQLGDRQAEQELLQGSEEGAGRSRRSSARTAPATRSSSRTSCSRARRRSGPRAPSTSFPGTVGQGENGNYGVAGEVSKNAGAIGYVSAYYALSQHGIYPASLENAAGKFEQADGATIEEAAKSNSTIPAQGSAFTSAGGV